MRCGTIPSLTLIFFKKLLRVLSFTGELLNHIFSFAGLNLLLLDLGIRIYSKDLSVTDKLLMLLQDIMGNQGKQNIYHLIRFRYLADPLGDS